ncbi:MAG TPA: rod shape-determining protein MreC [Patescibacteria group bacterium]
MQKRQRVVFVFIICAVIAILALLLAKTGVGTGISSAIQFVFSPLQKTVLHSSQNIKPQSDLEKAKQQIVQLQAENAKLQVIAQDNKALRDQFQTTNPISQNVIPAEIVGMPQFIPGVSSPEGLIIAATANMQVNMPIVYKDMLLGEITAINSRYAKVALVSSDNISFTAKTAQTGAVGIIKGQGSGQILFDNVLLSDNLRVGDMVVTTGETSFDGKGIPQGLIVGKITSIDKNPSSLFQKASVQMLVDVTRLSTVFALTQ